MSTKHPATGKMPGSASPAAPERRRHRSDDRAAIPHGGNRNAMRPVLLAAIVASAGLAGCVSLPGMSGPEPLDDGAYVRDVQVAVRTLGMVFEQADESVKAFQNGWLAPEGAASQFTLLHAQVNDVKAGMSQTEPPADMAMFHRQLGRSLSLTSQAMDSMGEGFRSGDPSYFQLASEQLNEARKVLDRAVDEL